MAPLFLYDFNSPYAYLAAARVDQVLGGRDRVQWQPIAFAFLLVAQQREPWSFHDPSRSEGVAECERRAAERGLPPMTWPEGWPRASYTIEPLRVALVAEEHGRLREYSMAAFARNFVSGTGLLGDAALEVAAEVGLDRATVEAGLPAAKARLREATDAAIAAGVHGVPTVTVGEQHFWGDDQLEAAAATAGGEPAA
jgi:2-hydroxychromene-2-carboxylate isomerase